MRQGLQCHTVVIQCVQCVVDPLTVKWSGAGVNWGNGRSSQSTLLSHCHSDTFFSLKCTFIWPQYSNNCCTAHGHKNKHRGGKSWKQLQSRKSCLLYFSCIKFAECVAETKATQKRCKDWWQLNSSSSSPFLLYWKQQSQGSHTSHSSFWARRECCRGCMSLLEYVLTFVSLWLSVCVCFGLRASPLDLEIR